MPINLLAETLNAMQEYGKGPEHVAWVGSSDGTLAISWDNFVLLAGGIWYNAGFGANEIPTDLVVVGTDWWLSRGEYDGSEWWNYNTCPIRQEYSVDFDKILDQDWTFARHLAKVNNKQEKGEWQQVLE